MATKECVACAEEILEKAQLCKHCGVLQNDPRFLATATSITPDSDDYEGWVKSQLSQSTFDDWVKSGKPDVDLFDGHIRISPKPSQARDTAMEMLSDSDFEVWVDAFETDDFTIVGGRLVLGPSARLGAVTQVAAPPAPGIAVAAIICAFLVPILGLILGYSARNEIRTSKGLKGGSGLATGAIVIGWIWVIAITIWVIVISMAAANAANELANLGNS